MEDMDSDKLCRPVELICPYCADPTVVDPVRPRCHSCHARIDLEATGRPFVPWPTRLLRVGALSLGVLTIVLIGARFAGIELFSGEPVDCSDRVPLPLRPDDCPDGLPELRCLNGEYVKACASLAAAPPASVTTTAPAAALRVQPAAENRRTKWQACFSQVDCRLACPATMRRGVGGAERADQCARAFDARCFDKARWSEACGEWGPALPAGSRATIAQRVKPRPAVFIRPTPVPETPVPETPLREAPVRKTPARKTPEAPVPEPREPPEPPVTCDSADCQRACGQYEPERFERCAHAFAGGCFTDPQASDGICGGFRGQF